MISTFNSLPWIRRKSRKNRAHRDSFTRLYRDAIKMSRIAVRFADGDVKDKLAKLKSVVDKALKWLRNKGRIIAQANPVVTRFFTMLLSLNAAFNAWGGVTELMATPSQIAAVRRYCEKTGRKFSEVTSELPPDQKPIRMFGNAIGTLLRAFAKALIAREITKMSAEKIEDAGVKGMKRGQHIKAKDPDYVESLKGGGGNGGGASRGSAPSQPQQKKGLTTRQKVGIGLMAGGGALMGAGLLGMHKAAKLGAAARKLPSPASMIKLV